MATSTTNYNLVKPDYNESADIDVINSNMDIIDEALNSLSNRISNTVSDYWNNSTIYEVGQYCIYDNKLWKCLVQHSGQTPTEGTYWTQTSIDKEFTELKSELVELENDIYDEEYKGVTDFTPNYNHYYYIENHQWLQNDYQHSIIVNCQSGEKYHTTGSVNADVIAPVVYFDSNDNYVGNVGLGTSGNYDLEITIPSNVTKVVFQNTGDAPTPTKLTKSLKIIMSKIKPLVVWKSGESYFVRCKYNSTKDAIYGFGKNENDNFNLYRIFLVDNADDCVKVSTDGISGDTQLYALSSEWLSPYSDMKAKNNIDGDYTEGWTGGSHKINGLQTMQNIYLGVYADKKNVTDNADITLCDEVKFVVLNKVYACNTLKNSGNSRPVLQEYIVYTVTPNKIDIFVELKVLEDISIANYYGFQQELAPWNAELVVGGSKIYKGGIDVSTASNINFDTRNDYKCNYWTSRKNGHDLVCELDGNFGIGDRRYLNDDTPTAHLHDWGKMYSYLIKDKDFSYGEILNYRGYYEFRNLN